MRRAMVCSLAVSVALACLAGRARAQDGKVHTVGTDGLKITGNVEGTDDRVQVVVGEKMGRLPAKMYQVKMKGGTKYVLNMASDDLDSFLVVQDADGKQLAFDDDSGKGNSGLDAKLDFTAPRDGTYKVFAASLKGTGKFALTIRQAGAAAVQPAEGKVYTIGKGGLKINGAIDANDKRVAVRPPGIDKDFPLPAKMYQVKMTAGAKYQVLMRSDDLDSVLVIHDAGGKQVAFDDDSGGGTNGLDSKLFIVPAKTGTYKVYAVSLKGTGKFTLTITREGGGKEDGNEEAGRPVGKEGLKITGELSEADKRVTVEGNGKTARLPAKEYAVRLTGGGKYRLEMRSPTLDSFLIIQDQGGKLLAFDDDSGGGTNGLDAQLDFTAPTSGTYKVFAASNAKETKPGKFVLTIRQTGGKEEARQDGGVREVGKDGLTIQGKLDADNTNRIYPVKLAEGKTYVIDMISPDTKALDPYLRLLDGTGAKLAEDDDSGGNLNARIVFRTPATGTYRIVAMSFLNAGRGEFTLQVREKE